MELVAVDIGGTHARFALADVADGKVGALEPATVLRTADYPSLESAWDAFADARSGTLPRAAAIAVACPVRGDVLKLTNNPWTIRPSALGERLGLDAHLLLNDFEAVGHAVAQVPLAHLAHVCGPDVALPDHGITTIVGPGTGLGVCQLFRDNDRYSVVACEGGHIDFAPLDAIEDVLLAELRTRHRRVSVERIVSGPGLAAIHAVLARIEGRAVARRDDKELWRAAIEGSDALATAALDRFCLCLGAIAGDLALVNGPTAVVIAGGLGLRLADCLAQSGFAARFTAKGRFESLMQAVPVRLITHPEPGLYGAAAAFAQEYAP